MTNVIEVRLMSAGLERSAHGDHECIKRFIGRKRFDAMKVFPIVFGDQRVEPRFVEVRSIMSKAIFDRRIDIRAVDFHAPSSGGDRQRQADVPEPHYSYPQINLLPLSIFVSFYIRLHHHAHELLESNLTSPTKLALRPRRIAQ